MNYKVEIIDEAKGEIKFGDTTEDVNTIKKVDILFDTIDDDVYSKGAGMLARMTVQGSITGNDSNRDNLMRLFNWAKSKVSEEQYRTVKVEVYDDDKRLRAYSFEKMFVVDYQEIYDLSGKNSQDDTKFILRLTQKENNFDKIKTFK